MSYNHQHSLFYIFLVPVKLITYPGPGALADDIANLDIGNIANETERAKTIEFSPAYCNIQVRHSHRRTGTQQTNI